jgi:hypothetical protein
MGNDLENVKRAIESIALIHPNVMFTLVDAARDVKLVATRKVRQKAVIDSAGRIADSRSHIRRIQLFLHSVSFLVRRSRK